MTADDLRVELAEINRQLSQLPADAFAARERLRARQSQLRAAAARLAADPRSDAELAAGLDRLLRRRDALWDLRLNPGHVGGGGGHGGGGFDPIQLAEMNAAIDAGHGRAGLEDRIEQLRRELRRRRG